MFSITNFIQGISARKSPELYKEEGNPYYFKMLPEELLEEAKKVADKLDYSQYDFDRIFKEVWEKDRTSGTRYFIGRRLSGVKENEETNDYWEHISKENSINMFKYILNKLEECKNYGKVVIASPYLRHLDSKNSADKKILDTIYNKYKYTGETDNGTPPSAKTLAHEYELLKAFIEDFLEVANVSYKKTYYDYDEEFDRYQRDLYGAVAIEFPKKKSTSIREKIHYLLNGTVGIKK